MRPVSIALLLAVATAAPLAVSPVAAKITHKEDALLAAGFVSRPATTPERTAMLSRLPQKKFVRRVTNGTTSYVYADQKDCNCLYVGSDQAYGKYRGTQQQQDIASQQEMAAMDYQDAAWNWGAWGPFDGPWGGFGFGPGFGW